MNSQKAEIGLRIKEARKALNMSQTELANHLEKTLRTVQKYESGEIEPSIAMVNYDEFIMAALSTHDEVGDGQLGKGAFFEEEEAAPAASHSVWDE